MSTFNIQNLYVERWCLLLLYMYLVSPAQVSLSFLTFAIHRFCVVVYHSKRFFQQKQWAVICITIQWIVGYSIAVPFLIRTEPYCTFRLWMNIYALMVIVIVPTCICLIINILVYKYARSSTKRIQPQYTSSTVHSDSIQQPKVSRRDLHLFRQMLFMFCLFAGGWTPVYFSLVLREFISFSAIIVSIFSLFATLCLLADTINMFVYDRELRKYLRDRIRQCIAFGK